MSHIQTFAPSYSELWAYQGETALLSTCTPEVVWEHPDRLQRLGEIVPDLSPHIEAIRFAGNGFGDHWCAYSSASHGEGIALFMHDITKAELYAPSLAGFVFRQLLELLASAELSADDSVSDRDVLIEIFEDARHSSGCLPPDLRMEIDQLLTREPRVVADAVGDKIASLLTEAEVQEVLRRSSPWWLKWGLGTEMSYVEPQGT